MVLAGLSVFAGSGAFSTETSSFEASGALGLVSAALALTSFTGAFLATGATATVLTTTGLLTAGLLAATLGCVAFEDIGDFEAAALGLAAGCGGSTLTGGEEGGLTSNPSGAPISEQQLPNQFVDAFCGNIGPCCQAAAIAFDLTTCKQNLSATIGAALVQEMAPKISYDASAAGRCSTWRPGTCAAAASWAVASRRRGWRRSAGWSPR